jgi:hypothetical protein
MLDLPGRFQNTPSPPRLYMAGLSFFYRSNSINGKALPLSKPSETKMPLESQHADECLSDLGRSKNA